MYDKIKRLTLQCSYSSIDSYRIFFKNNCPISSISIVIDIYAQYSITSCRQAGLKIKVWTNTC